MVYMVAIQTHEEIQSLLARTEGLAVSALQVLGINSLKSVSPMPHDLNGEIIESANLDGRTIAVTTATHLAVFDLQRTGKLVWLANAKPYTVAAGLSRPTVRLILANGDGIDLTEPARTKRITVTLSNLE